MAFKPEQVRRPRAQKLLAAKQPYASGREVQSLRRRAEGALRDAREQVKTGGARQRAPDAYNRAFNNGLVAGASIVEAEVYGCLPPED